MVVFDELKSIGKVLQEAGKIEQYKLILEIQEKLLELQKNNAQLEQDNDKLKEKLSIRDSLEHKNDAYWIDKKDGRDGPFCTRCWDKGKDLVRLHARSNEAYATCPDCKNQVCAWPGRGRPPQASPPRINPGR